ncbi:MAG: hypothetical protein IJ685_09750 [Selenomonadaceae bacterium]|nr:hypothetical protein [Selenomonadaceae bacterium]
MKKFLFALIALLFVTAQVSAAEAPVRIAVLPIIFNSAQPDAETCAELEIKIARATHIPLNDTLKVAEYIPPAQSTKVLTEIWRLMRSADKKAKIQNAMRPLAEDLDADIVVCPILLSYNQNYSGAFTSDETYLSSHVRAELIIYDRRTDTLTDKKFSRMYNDMASNFGTASFLAKECFDRLIDDTKLRQTFFAIGK